jgi:hypothetical protein
MRVAVSVIFGVLTMALCVLWGRSYWLQDYFASNQWSFVCVSSNNGYLILDLRPGKKLHTIQQPWWAGTTKANGWVPSSIYKSEPRKMLIATHFCVPAVTFAGVAVAFGAGFLSTRFSLRDMLIATTLVAVVLGLGVWLAR